MKIWAFLKVRNEILREGNIHRCLRAIRQLGCTGGILCDDASTDGTDAVLEAFVREESETSGPWSLLRVPRAAQDFKREMVVKEEMLGLVHRMAEIDRPDFLFWLDGDEAIADVSRLRAELEALAPDVPGLVMHYVQFWRTEAWARIDGGFDDGVFCKAWRYRPDLTFDAREGTHQRQYPKPIEFGRCRRSMVDVLHYGNYGKNLVWKGIQYSGGLGGVDRHIAFGHSPKDSLASGIGFDRAEWSEPKPRYRYVGPSTSALPEPPRPFTAEEVRRIRAMGAMKKEAGTFAVVVPAFNRAATLPKALDSLLEQTYEKWFAFVLDDGSTDDTPAVMRRYQDLDPRILYARYSENRGGVAMNEIGMQIACESAEYWSRLGSDDWFGPRKLELDAKALELHDACYGRFTVVRGGKFSEICNPPADPDAINARLLKGQFVVSWANIAARTSALERVRDRFGGFCDLRLRNCEDFLCNARLAATGTEFYFREPESPELEAVWTCAAEGGASSPENAAVLARDEVLTRQLIAEMK